ncbi:hypothetical protein POPTR_012G095700v4 [Populus trichocarpa]|uniref:Uncharacterized protein n=1 Tax=Populus trichocarpa TaxID=3694 RepID=A0ACC0S553_POPTR|nr:hypothetical protein POPTR_012G095700v4 [Populus trichocarpa]
MADTAYFNGETVLDGIPRKQFQVEILDQLVEIDLAVGFRCTDDYLVKQQQAGAWKQKLQAYAEQSRPLEDCYQKRKRLLDFQVGSAPAENWQGLLAALHLQHTNTVYSSKKLAVRSSLL